MASETNKVTFQTQPNKYCDFSLYGVREAYAKVVGPDGNFDVEDVNGTLFWQAEISTSPAGIHSIDLSGQLDSVSFVLSIWQEDAEDLKQPITIDTSKFNVRMDIERDDSGGIVPTSVDIDLKTKEITVS